MLTICICYRIVLQYTSNYGESISDVLKEVSGIFDFLSSHNEEDMDSRNLFAVREHTIDTDTLEEAIICRV